MKVSLLLSSRFLILRVFWSEDLLNCFDKFQIPIPYYSYQNTKPYLLLVENVTINRMSECR